VYLVTDAAMCRGRSLEDVVAAAIRGGVTCVQLRDKAAPTRDLLALALALQPMLRAAGIPFVMNDRLDVALTCAADGLHLGQSDLPVTDARRLVPHPMFIGLSVDSFEDLETVAGLDVDYLGISPVFASTTKLDTKAPWGLEGLRRARAHTTLPLVAIGGINADNASQVFAAGADGVAVVSAICAADDPEKATRRLVQSAHSVQAPTMTLPPRHPEWILRYRRVLSIAGSDSGGGAGIQADLKTFSALGCFGMTAITAVTAQNTRGVTAIHSLPVDLLAQQIEAVVNDIGVDAVKIGMLHTPAVVRAVANELPTFADVPIILDPVMVATSGDKLIDDATISVLVRELFPYCELITPNLDEASVLLGWPVREVGELEPAILSLRRLGCRSVLLKGGHLSGERIVDTLLTESGDIKQFQSPRIHTPNVHGTGCSLSSAIAAYRALGEGLVGAVEKARNFIAAAIQAGAHVTTGAGHGPLNHGFAPQSMVVARLKGSRP
jgi:hydroxymethylpyrimidine kinase / phosphomethylpyrimidine kinase / thiamine-phosphate diphosphorylase